MILDSYNHLDKEYIERTNYLHLLRTIHELTEGETQLGAYDDRKERGAGVPCSMAGPLGRDYLA